MVNIRQFIKWVGNLLITLYDAVFLIAKNKYLWRKANKDDLVISRYVIRISSGLALFALLLSTVFVSSSDAYSLTWEQTNWDGGVGPSTLNQYDSALGIDADSDGQFGLSRTERLLNNSFDANLDNWTTGKSELEPAVVATSIKAGATATSHSLDLTSEPQVGNVLVAAISFRTNPGTITMPDGWNQDVIETNPSSGGRVAIYHKIVEPSESTTVVVQNSTSATVNFTVQELTGVDLESPVDQISAGNSGATNQTTAEIPPTPMTTRKNAIAIARVGYDNQSAFSSWSDGFVNYDLTNTWGYTGTKVLNFKQEVSTTFTAVTVRRTIGVMVVYNGAFASQFNSVNTGVVQSRAYTTEQSHTLTLDSQPQEGNTLVVTMSHSSNPGIVTMPDGWIQDVDILNPTYPQVTIYRKVVGPNEPRSFVVYRSIAGVSTYTVHELENVDTTDPVDRTSTVQSGAGTSTTVAIPATSETTVSNAIALARVGYQSNSNYSSWSNGFTASSTANDYGYTASKILNSTQQVSTTFVGTVARRTAGALVVYKGEGSSTPNIVQDKTYLYSQSPAISALYESPISKGNTLFATFATRGNQGTVTAPPGWNQVAFSQSLSGRSTFLYSKIADDNEDQHHHFNSQFNLSGTITIFEVRGILTNSPLDQLTTFGNVNSNPLTFSIPTVSQNNAFILGGIGSNSTSGFPVGWPTNGFTTVLGSLAQEFQTGHRIQTSASPYNLSFTNASARILQGFLAAFKAGGEYVGATRNTTTKYTGDASARIYASPWANARFVQTVNVGDTENYQISVYAYALSGVIDDTVAALIYDGEVIPTDYEVVGGGWYRLSAEITGEDADKDFGIEVYKDNTVFVDDFSVSRLENTGTLTSNIFDTERLSNWGELSYVYSGNGNVIVKARSSNSADMVGAPNFSTCAPIVSGSDISDGTNGCVTDAEQYIQYQVILEIDNGQSPVFEEIRIDYTGADEIPPETNATDIAMYRSNGGASIALNGWTGGNTPYFSWNQGLDNPGGIGVAGYCVYLGQDETADPVTTKGLLGTGDLNVRGTCPFATENDFLDTSLPNILASQLVTDTDPYYINIKAIDGNGNVFDGPSESFHFRFDNVAPSNPAFINAPSSFVNSKQVTLTWPTTSGSAPSDTTSGIAGLQYRIGSSGTWYGANHTGDQDFSDLLPNNGEYTTQATPDFDDLVEGNNIIHFRTWDNAGNVSQSTVTTVIKINTAGAPSSPQNIIATPATNTVNEFAFSWTPPTTFVGNVNTLTYCYTVNTLPNASNCTYTSPGVTSVPAGAYANQPGINTFYVVARDESSSINYATAASVEFTANTSAPGIPLSLDLADTSVRTTSNWRLVVSWEPPTNVGAGVNSYEVFRSADGTNFARAGSTSGTSYVDTSLNQVEYFYKVRACDSANNCGAFSSVMDMTPTGRFTTPPLMTSAGGKPRATDIQTRSVKISWSTDRNADTKVAFGTKSGVYSPTEAYSSKQTTDHEIVLDNLTPGTTYFFVARWTDTDGNTGVSTEQVFQTLPPPTVEDVNAIQIGLNNATIQYTTTGAAAVKLYYGQTNGFGAVIETQTSLSKSTYLTVLPDLLDGTEYFYKINTIDASGFEYDGTTISFQTPPAPRINNLRFQPVEGEPSSTQLVSWETNVPATSEISYGRVGGETLTALNTSLTTNHEIVIKQLADDSVYNLTARSRDASGNLATSDNQTFRTALDTRPPEIFDVTVVASIQGTGTEARGQVIVSWKTDEPATSQVAYGEGTAGSFSNTTAVDSRMSLDHSVVISDLPTSRIYSLAPISLDKANNETQGDTQTAIVGRSSESALSIILSVLQKIFGVGI